MKIGLIGFHCRTGLGELNRQIHQYVSLHHWLIRSHKSKSTLGLEGMKSVSIGSTLQEVDDFISSVDVVLFCETPYWDHVPKRAKDLGKRVVCVPMQEWTPDSSHSWIDSVDLFICPTRHCYDELSGRLPCHYLQWPVDVSRYAMRTRTTCDRFLFINGNGGWHGRKGLSVVEDLVRLWPEIPLTVRSQSRVPDSLRPFMVEGEARSSQELYKDGDVLLCPHSVDGLGLEVMEAMACGLPVVCTEGRPWNEYPCISYVRSTKGRIRINREVDWYTPSPQHLYEVCSRLLGTDIEGYSLSGRAWTDSLDWRNKIEEFTNLVRNGNRTIELGAA